MATTAQKSVGFKKHNNATAAKGFTLIEVMVALAIIAISLGALITTSGSQANNAAYLKQKSIAHWVATYELTKLQAEKSFPSAGTKNGSTEMAGFEWHWTRTTEQAGSDKDARTVKFNVYANKSREQSLISLTGFVTK